MKASLHKSGTQLLNDTIRDYKKRLVNETGKADFLKNGFRKLGYKDHFLEEKKEKNREVTMPLPRVYFFFAGAFFTSFLTGFLAI